MRFQTEKFMVDLSDENIENIIWMAGIKILPAELQLFDDLDPYGKYLLPKKHLAAMDQGFSKIENYKDLPFELNVPLLKLKKITQRAIENDTAITIIGE